MSSESMQPVSRELTQAKFLSLLFDEHEASCFTESEHGYRVNMAPASNDLFFCINALHPSRDLAPIKDWHREDLPRRADANVVTHRNFLIELDDMPLSEQIEYVTSRVPVSSIVYSGGKSYHFIVSLEKAVESDKYKELARRLHKLLPKADRACKNASRLSRLPGVIMPETNKMQTLTELRNRIPNIEFEAVLPILAPRKKVNNIKYLESVPSLVLEACVFPDDIIEKYNLGGRNAFFFWLYNRMEEANMSEQRREDYVEQAYENLRDVSGFGIEEARSAARLVQ